MTDLVKIIAEAWGQERARHKISSVPSERPLWSLTDSDGRTAFTGMYFACERHRDTLCATAALRALRARGYGIGETEADGTGEDWRVVGRDLVPAALTPSRAS